MMQLLFLEQRKQLNEQIEKVEKEQEVVQTHYKEAQIGILATTNKIVQVKVDVKTIIKKDLLVDKCEHAPKGVLEDDYLDVDEAV
jgi:hypothetical protein